MNRSEKAAVVDELKALLAGAKVAMLADHRGLSVSELTELRRLLYQQGVVLRVVKNSLARLATRGTELQGLEAHLAGPTAMVFGKDDPTLLAKLLVSYAKTKPNFQIKAGFAEGKVLATHEAQALAELPSREVLLATFAGVLQSPMRGFLIVLQGPARSLLLALEGLRQKKEQTPSRA